VAKKTLFLTFFSASRNFFQRYTATAAKIRSVPRHNSALWV